MACFLFAELVYKVDISLLGDSKESFYFGSLEGVLAQRYPNQWPSEGNFFLTVSLICFNFNLSRSRIMCMLKVSCHHGGKPWKLTTRMSCKQLLSCRSSSK